MGRRSAERMAVRLVRERDGLLQELVAALEAAGREFAVAGRLVRNRGAFLLIQDGSDQIQLYIDRKGLAEEALEEARRLAPDSGEPLRRLALIKMETGLLHEAIETMREALALDPTVTAGHFVLGIPGETGESLEKTLDLARRLPLDFAQFYCAVPFPGARLYEKAKEKGWLGSKDSNLDSRLQRPMSCRWTTPQEIPGGLVNYRQEHPQKDKWVPCGTHAQRRYHRPGGLSTRTGPG